MKISLKWLSKFVEIPKINGQELARLFTIHTAEVEGVVEEGKAFEKIVVGKILQIKPHPNADKLRIAITDIGGNTAQIVCGGINLKEGMKVAVALPGSRVKWHGQGNFVTLEQTKIRGEESFGMICAGEEIGLPSGGEHEILDLKTDANPGTPLAEALGKNDIILEIDNKSLTHRPDLWGHYGIAREISAIFETKLKPYEKAVKLAKDSDFTDKKLVKIDIEKPEICRRFTACVISNVKIEESPDWLKRDLIAASVRPVNNVVDVTNHIMLGLGQPMHAYDRSVSGGHFIIRKAKPGEKFETIDHKIRTLSPGDVVITNEKEILALAGVMGGKNSEISNRTTEIIFEAATWNPQYIRRTSTRHMLRTDAVQRFEKSLDPKMAETAIRRACALLKQICPSAKIGSALIDIKNYEDKKIIVEVNIEKIQKKIGAKIPAKEMVKILKRLKFEAKKSGKNIIVEVPSFRATKDISIEDDITEEIARIYGYEKIESKLPELPIRLPRENRERKLKHKAKDILSFGLGFSEVYNYSFCSKEDLKNALLPEEPHLLLENYLSEDQTHLRTSLIPNLLKNISQNLRFFETFKIYEIGRTYQEIKEYFPLEEKWIAAAVTNITNQTNGFYQAKGALEKFLDEFGIKNYQTRETKSFYPPYAHPKKFLAYEWSEGNEFARIFELHPIVKKNLDLEKREIAIFEINFTKIANEGNKEKKYAVIPRFPGIAIDISVVIDQKKPISEIQKLINISELIEKIELFDLYEGKNIEQGKKAVAFKILLQAKDRTLTDEEMSVVQKKIFDSLQAAGGTIRGL